MSSEGLLGMVLSRNTGSGWEQEELCTPCLCWSKPEQKNWRRSICARYPAAQRGGMGEISLHWWMVDWWPGGRWAAQGVRNAWPKGKGDCREGRRKGGVFQEGLWDGSGLGGEGDMGNHRGPVTFLLYQALLWHVWWHRDLQATLSAISCDLSGIGGSFLPWQSHHFCSLIFLCKSAVWWLY